MQKYPTLRTRSTEAHRAHRARIITTVVCLALTLACGSTPNAYRLSEKISPSRLLPDGLSFLLLADTQYAVPFSDYDVKYSLGKQFLNLGPEITTLFEGSFYRHAAAHWAVPGAVEAIVRKESHAGAKFGLFGGDLVEFSCATEADRMFEALASGPQLPFIVALGNHDVVFHGSYDTDGAGMGGEGPWDTYSFALWGSVCSQAGGRLTKTGFIRRLLAYYATTWGLDIRKALQVRREDDFPLGIPLAGRAESSKFPEWELSFALRLSADDDPRSHRLSYFFQRWTRTNGPTRDPDLDITVLDTTDYSSRSVLCEPTSRLLQIGLSGAISTAQVEWLETSRQRKPAATSIALSHYMPFEGIEEMGRCEGCNGERCLRKRLQAALGESTYVYAHVHRPFREESLEPSKCESSGGKRQCSEADGNALPLVRLPSLIDNKSYVVFAKGSFQSRDLPEPKIRLESEAPMKRPGESTCARRFREFVELRRNLNCLRTGGVCESLDNALAERAADGIALCAGTGIDPSCEEWPRDARFRCELRRRTKALLATEDDAAAILKAVQTRRVSGEDHAIR